MTATTTYSLARLYDADQRTRDGVARGLAARVFIPHPLTGVAYADGVYEPPQPDYCGRGICAALEGHAGTCDEASGWAE